MVSAMIVLGIESSCDESAAALVDDQRRILADLVRSQDDTHRLYGGVVPEAAARAHLDVLPGLIERAMAQARVSWDEIDGIAATAGPGLIGGVIVGATMGKAIAMARGLPFVAVNHLEGHALTPRLIDDLAFPYLLLLVSGGHCQLLTVEAVGRYRRYGTTVDDAVGEAFDKAAKLLGLGYPGGPAIERAAAVGDAARYALPRPMLGRPGCDFSFSGLKTALRHAVVGIGTLSRETVADLAASFQAATTEVLVDRTTNGLRRFVAEHGRPTTLVVAGGVAANLKLRRALWDLADREGFAFVAPPPKLCTDNAAMIAWAGIERLKLGMADLLDFAPRPRWPLDPDAPPAIGAGVKA
jgi:N6-L-threonylcarbamoyladenine synthase